MSIAVVIHIMVINQFWEMNELLNELIGTWRKETKTLHYHEAWWIKTGNGWTLNNVAIRDIYISISSWWDRYVNFKWHVKRGMFELWRYNLALGLCQKGFSLGNIDLKDGESWLVTLSSCLVVTVHWYNMDWPFEKHV